MSNISTTDRDGRGESTAVAELSWQPIQRSTRFAVFVALCVTVFYMIFLLNPAYRGDTWVWILVLFAEGITILNALAMWYRGRVRGDLRRRPHSEPRLSATGAAAHAGPAGRLGADSAGLPDRAWAGRAGRRGIAAIFYELVLPGRNYFNAVFCVGTNVIFRRVALEQIHGMHIASNSEDIWTSIELHRRGWRSFFVPEVLARGLAPDSLLPYFKQQFRWAYGAFEVMLRGGLFRRRGLTMDQRIQYLLAGVNYLLSVAALILMCLPAAYLLFGLSPIRTDINTWIVHYAPFYLLIMLVTVLQLGGFKPAAIVTSVAAAPVHVKALVMAAVKRNVRWTVTNSGAAGLPGVELVLPHIALLLLNAVAVAVGVSMLPLRGTDVVAVGLSIGWAVIYVLILGRVVACRAMSERLFSASSLVFWPPG